MPIEVRAKIPGIAVIRAMVIPAPVGMPEMTVISEGTVMSELMPMPVAMVAMMPSVGVCGMPLPIPGVLEVGKSYAGKQESSKEKSQCCFFHGFASFQFIRRLENRLVNPDPQKRRKPLFLRHELTHPRKNFGFG